MSLYLILRAIGIVAPEDSFEFPGIVPCNNSGSLFRILKNRGRVETQPRCKIQYPMKNRYEDAHKKLKRCTSTDFFLKNNSHFYINKKPCIFSKMQGKSKKNDGSFLQVHYFFYQLNGSWNIRQSCSYQVRCIM